MAINGRDGVLKYEFRVAPGARVDDIKLAYRGTDGDLSTDAAGRLLIDTAIGALHDEAPVSYQVIGDQRVPVDSRYQLTGAGSAQSYGFSVGSYDPARELVIDPGLEYSTFLGGAANQNGAALVYSTFLGGSNGVIRPDWRQSISGRGLVYNDTQRPTGEVVSYWREGPFYDFTAAEVDALHADAETLFEMCVAAGDHILDHGLLYRLGIPEFAWDQIARTWYDDDTGPGGRSRGDFSPSLYGRFDLRYDGADGSRPQLLEFNADTPTSLPESAVIQWYWHMETGQGKDQWNALHERLIEAWRRNIDRLRQARPHLPHPLTIHFACDAADDSGEEVFNTEYLMETARQALGPMGYQVKFLWMNQIGAGDPAAGDHFYDADLERIHVIFKLYPWEWMTGERFARQCFRDMGDPQRDSTVWIEPPYKMLWSNKGLLPVLWKLFGDDPARRDLLLPAYFEAERPSWLTSYVRKPLLGREGANVTIVVDNQVRLTTPGPYDAGPFVCQAFAPLPAFPDEQGAAWHPVLGLWLIDGEPAGLGIRESSGLVTDNLSHFVPHAIDYTTAYTTDHTG